MCMWCIAMNSNMREQWTVPSKNEFLQNSYHLIKGKVVPVLLTEHHAMKDYWGNGGIVPRILDLSTRLRWMVSFTPRPLYPNEKKIWYPLDRRLGGLQSRSGGGGKEKNSQPLPGLELPIIQPVSQSYTTELSHLYTMRGCNQNLPDWVTNEIWAYNDTHSLRSNTKGYGGKTH
jgi:hypothetical protein